MNKVELLNGVSLSFIGDAVYSLFVRDYCLRQGINKAKQLQEASIRYVSAKGQKEAYGKLLQRGFLNEEEMAIFRKGRNAINHIPKNGNLIDYSIASGLEAVCGYLYYTDQERLKEMFAIIL